MTTHSLLGQPALFRLTQSPVSLEAMSERERRLLVGALNFHALMAPGRTLDAHFYAGSWLDRPRTTDDATFDGLSRAFGRRELSLTFESTVIPEPRTPRSSEAVAQELIAHPARHLHISRDDVLEHEPPRDIVRGGSRRVLRALRNRGPLLYDELRDLELLRHRRAATSFVPRRDYAGEFLPGGAHEKDVFVPAPNHRDGARRAVIIGMHWFELGGAERWAFETVRLVREAGLLPIVITNRDSHQPWIARPELDGALLVPLSEPTVHSQTTGVEEVLRALFGTFDVRGVVVHHNQWLYDRLPWIARSRPGIRIIDSTHIVEYRGGGYPRSSAVVADSITAHHVISPTLATWMRDVQRIPADKVVMAPLGGLTADLGGAGFRARGDAPFTVAFVGRLARQKAPEVFLEIAARVRAKRRGARFVLHGEGELAPWVDDLVRRARLGDAIVRRDASVPVTETLNEAHLLVVSSHNEGLTLTSLEAIAHGVPVLSTDVGAQRDIIPIDALVPRNVHRAVRVAVERIIALIDDEEARHNLWVREREAERTLLQAKPATQWFTEEVRSW